ncbi:hypothetical protein ACFXTH_004256 [Malus domestica]|uniref:Uncharacterized protein n=1 Tax=Malus domestica TaxID=3750 RepID=A0A498IWJ2_MALDO|nr:hypothetical protein DVH24_021948 [Malus domestica]
MELVEKIGGGMEILELDGEGEDGGEGVGELGSGMANGGLEGSNRGSDGGEGRELGVVEGRELGEEVGVAGEDLGTERREGGGWGR